LTGCFGHGQSFSAPGTFPITSSLAPSIARRIVDPLAPVPRINGASMAMLALASDP